MNRRRFLIAAGIGSAALAAPWVRWWWTRVTIDAPDVGDAIERARSAGKPLLVFVIPEQARIDRDRGVDFARVLLHGSDETLAALALCEIICARVRDLGQEMSIETGANDPWIVLVEPGGGSRVGPVAVTFDAELPPIDIDDWEHRDEIDAQANARIAALSSVIRGALIPTEEALARRARQSAATLKAEDRARIERLAEAPEELPPPLAERGAARVLERATARGRRDAATRVLADIAISRLRAAAPEGAAWARSLPCALELNGRVEFNPLAWMPGVTHFYCGIAQCPPRAERFLYFFAEQR